MKKRIRMLAAWVMFSFAILAIIMLVKGSTNALAEEPVSPQVKIEAETEEAAEAEAQKAEPAEATSVETAGVVEVAVAPLVVEPSSAGTIEERIELHEETLARLEAEKKEARETANLIPTIDGGVLYLTLDDVKANIHLWYSAQDIREATLIVQAEDEIAQSQTIWAAHVWLFLGRIGCGGFVNNANLHAVLSDTTQFPTYTAENLAKPINKDIEWVVIDVFARKVIEDAGAVPEAVGRVLPSDVHFFNMDGVSKYNRFYRYCWGDEYNPFDSPYNPYDN